MSAQSRGRAAARGVRQGAVSAQTGHDAVREVRSDDAVGVHCDAGSGTGGQFLGGALHQSAVGERGKGVLGQRQQVGAAGRVAGHPVTF